MPEGVLRIARHVASFFSRSTNPILAQGLAAVTAAATFLPKRQSPSTGSVPGALAASTPVTTFDQRVAAAIAKLAGASVAVLNRLDFEMKVLRMLSTHDLLCICAHCDDTRQRHVNDKCLWGPTYFERLKCCFCHQDILFGLRGRPKSGSHPHCSIKAGEAL